MFARYFPCRKPSHSDAPFMSLPPDPPSGPGAYSGAGHPGSLRVGRPGRGVFDARDRGQRAVALTASNVQMESLNTNSAHPCLLVGRERRDRCPVSRVREGQGRGGPDRRFRAVHALSEAPRPPLLQRLASERRGSGASVSPDNVITVDLSAKAFGSELDRAWRNAPLPSWFHRNRGGRQCRHPHRGPGAERADPGRRDIGLRSLRPHPA